jgi:hypothetical protein
MKVENTERGFDIVKFFDDQDNSCSLQKSSSASGDCIWLGLNDAKPMILASEIIVGGTGWAKYPLHHNVVVNTRMHLTIEQVKELLPYLIKFVETGDIA